MTERRLRQIIHHSPIGPPCARAAGGEDGQRDRYLMMGLTNPEIIAPWLDIMHVQGAYLAGIWLLPALSMSLARQLRLTRSRLLLVTEQTGGLRLTYLEDGELRFSRLAPVDGSQYESPGKLRRGNRAHPPGPGGPAPAGANGAAANGAAGPPQHPVRTPRLPAGIRRLPVRSIQRGQLLDTLGLPPSLLTESADALYLSLLPGAPASAPT